MAPTVKIMKDF